ncbi:MAG: ABC transporter ATP-binding protein/permease [candidate division KSB1 bacterium]|nr:ABC transporter ATP-binding protein/permease [candidate division KSB1 bacterium]
MMNQYHEEEVLGRAYDSRLLKRLLRYLKPFWFQVILAVAILLSVTALELAGPYLIKIAIDRHIVTRISQGFITIVLLYLAVLALHFVFLFLQTYVMQWIGQQVIYNIRLELFRHLLQLSLSFFDRNPVGRLVTRLTSDVEALNEWFSAGIVSVFGDLFLLIGIIIVMISVHWKLALITFAVLPLLAYVLFFIRSRIRDAYRDIRVRIARINAYLQENITGMMVVQIFNRERRNFNQFDQLNRNHLEAQLRSVFYFSLLWPSIDVIESLALALILWFGALWKYQGAVTFGTLVLFIEYSRRFFRPISDLTDKYNILQSAMASSERIFLLLDQQPEIVNPRNPIRIRQFRGAIEFRNVWFAYKSNRDQSPEWVLKDISFRVNPGEKIAIVGATGAGKSSIINLLCRFYDVHQGEILLDGINIKDLDLPDLRSRIGLVLQDVFLFAGTVADNIRLKNETISAAAISDAARDANALPFIEKLPDQFNYQVMERGASLSTGQKQLLAFARALAFNPQILILDEATSSVDTESELLIQQALKKLMNNRTSICIAHRLSTIQNCDRIIVLHKGTIREEGTHQELLRLKGIYYRLYRLQFMDRNFSEAA